MTVSAWPSYWPPLEAVQARARTTAKDARAAGRLVAFAEVPLSSVYLAQVKLVRGGSLEAAATHVLSNRRPVSLR